MKKKILFTLPSLAMTDSKLPRVLEICKALPREEFEPMVSVDHQGRLNSHSISCLNAIDVPVHILRFSPHRSDLLNSSMELLATASRLRKYDISIQHSFDYSMWWFEPLVVKLAGIPHWITTKASSDCKGLHWYIRLNLAKYVTAQSSAMREILTRDIPSISKKTLEIVNGVDTNHYRPGKKMASEIRKEFGLEQDDLVLGCVAHMVPYKDHPSLLRAFSKVKSKKIYLWLIGRTVVPSYEENLRRMVSELGLDDRVSFLGLRSDVDILLNGMDGIILTSREDSVSNAILQAMSSGLPVISTDCGGMPNLVQTGVNGWLLNGEGDPVDQIANAIQEWADNDHERVTYGTNSRNIVLSKFSIEKMTAGYIQLYRSLVD